MKHTWTLPSLLATVSLAACSHVESDWKQASTADTQAAYQQFLNKHPSGAHSSDAKTRIDQLRDSTDWDHAKTTNTPQSYADYLQNEPAGSHRTEAQAAQQAAQRVADWDAANKANSPTVLRDFLKKYPQSAESTLAEQQLAAMGSYRVRLAARHNRHQAEHDRAHLQERYANVLHEVNIVASQSGKTFSAESASMSHAEASKACDQLKHDHVNCEVVKDASAQG